MEENKQLLAKTNGRCEEILHPTDDGKLALRAFLKTFAEVVSLDGNKDFEGKVYHDMQLALMECDEMELARQVGKMELEARRASLAASQQQKSQLYIGTINGSLSAYYENEEVNVVQEEMKN